MTWEVMAQRREKAQKRCTPVQEWHMRLGILVLVTVGFIAYTVSVMAQAGVLGFLELRHDPWGMQLLLDLFIMLGLFALWVLRDAKERGLPAWPWAVTTIVMGSMGALSYLLYREVVARRAQASPGALQSRR